MITYFKNIIIRLHILYVFNTYVEFRVNVMLFTIRIIKLFFIHNLDYKSLKFNFIDNISIYVRSSKKFTSVKNIRRKFNVIVNLLKFTPNKKILSEIIVYRI